MPIKFQGVWLHSSCHSPLPSPPCFPTPMPQCFWIQESQIQFNFLSKSWMLTENGHFIWTFACEVFCRSNVDVLIYLLTINLYCLQALFNVFLISFISILVSHIVILSRLTCFLRTQLHYHTFNHSSKFDQNGRREFQKCKSSLFIWSLKSLSSSLLTG